MKIKDIEFQKGIWPLIDKFNMNLKHFIIINNKGNFDTIYGLLKAFSGDDIIPNIK